MPEITEIRPVQEGHATVDIGAVLDEGHWSRAQKAFIGLTALTIVVDGIDNQLLAVSIPTLMAEWGVTRGAFASALAAGMLGMVVGGTGAGLVGDRLGRRVALLSSVLVFGVLTLAAAFAPNLATLAVLRFLAGLGLGGAMPNAAAFASEFAPRRHRAIAVTATIVCVPLGSSIGALLAGALLPAFGWRTLFIVGGGLALITAAMLWRWLPESPRYLARHPERWPELISVLRRIGHPVSPDTQFSDASDQVVARASVGQLFVPGLRRDSLALFLAFFCCLLAVYASFSWVPSMLTGAGLSLPVAARGLSAFNMGGVVGALAGGFVIARIGSRVTMLGMAAAAVGCALVMASMSIGPSSAFAVVSMLALTGGLINAVQTTMYALAAHVYPTALRATGVGTAVGVGRIGAVLSSYAGAWVLESAGTTGFFSLLAVSMTIVFVALAIVQRHVPAAQQRVRRAPL